MSARSMPRRRSCRSAPAPETAWAPGSAGYDGSRKAPRPDNFKRFAQRQIFLQMIRNDSGNGWTISGTSAVHHEVSKNRRKSLGAADASQIKNVIQHVFTPPKGGNQGGTVDNRSPQA